MSMESVDFRHMRSALIQQSHQNTFYTNRDLDIEMQLEALLINTLFYVPKQGRILFIHKINFLVAGSSMR